MKKAFLISLMILISINVFSQSKVYSLKDEGSNNKMKDLESLYRNGIGQDSIDAIFYTEEDMGDYSKKWSEFLGDISKYLKENDLILNDRIFFRIFFTNDGSIDYLFYNVQNKESDLLLEENKKRFESLLSQFAEVGKFNITTKDKFKQCGSGNFQTAPK